MADESPVEPFKRALAHAARSLAEQPDLEVVFSNEGPALYANRAVLPHPPRDLPPREAARIRGMADQMALWLSHHDKAAHAKFKPAAPDAGEAFEAIEKARVEAIGSNAMGGVKANLTAALEAALEKRGLTRPVERAEPPMADILGLMVRERLTGQPPAPAPWSTPTAPTSRRAPARAWTGWPRASMTRPPSPALPAAFCVIST
jgi:cobaltochelatase CobT